MTGAERRFAGGPPTNEVRRTLNPLGVERAYFIFFRAGSTLPSGSAKHEEEPGLAASATRHRRRREARRAQLPSAPSLDAVDVNTNGIRLLSKLEVMDQVGVCYQLYGSG